LGIAVQSETKMFRIQMSESFSEIKRLPGKLSAWQSHPNIGPAPFEFATTRIPNENPPAL
jgi:hypothetical protein